MAPTDTLTFSAVAEPTSAIAEVVERTGVGHDTLRYDEKAGLVAPPRDGRRRYRDAVLARRAELDDALSIVDFKIGVCGGACGP